MDATASNILAMSFYSAWYCSSILCALVTVATAVYIYKVLRLSMITMQMILLFTMIVAPISMLNELNSVAVLVYWKARNSQPYLLRAIAQFGFSLFGFAQIWTSNCRNILWTWLLPMGIWFSNRLHPKVIGVLWLYSLAIWLILHIFVPGFPLIISEYTGSESLMYYGF